MPLTILPKNRQTFKIKEFYLSWTDANVFEYIFKESPAYL